MIARLLFALPFLARNSTVIFFLSAPTCLLAQAKPVARYERPYSSSDHEFIVQPMGARGLAMIRDEDKFEKGKKKWEVTFVDSTLHQFWQIELYVDIRKNIIGHDFYQGNVYLIYQETEISREIILIEINPATQSYKAHSFKPEADIRFVYFTIVKSKAIFGGYIQSEATLFMYDLNNEVARVIPGTFRPKVELLDIRTNVNGTFNVILKEKPNKLVIHTFDETGVMLFEKIITIEDKKTILEAQTSTLERDEMVIMGTWTFGNNKLASGIFSVVVDVTQDLPVNYYWLTELEHFLDYQKPEKAAKLKAKNEWRKGRGKSSSFRVNLSVEHIKESKNGFFLLTEAYEAPASYYNSRWSSPYGYSPYNYYSPYNGGYYPYAFNSMPSRYYYPYGSPYSPYGSSSNYNPSNQMRIFQTSLAYFDLKGELLHDRSLKFKEIKMTTKDQVSDFVEYEGVVTLACKNEQEINVEYARDDGSEPVAQKLTTVMDENEISKSESQENSGIRAWYDGYFYVFGYQTVKNNIDRKSRDVFYINKIKGG
ncbi:MAG: hypothetical protein JSS93_10715 [Bacteroidetes bacterium]|nr:hypothetical protein [Bacteroidota bacterium]